MRVVFGESADSLLSFRQHLDVYGIILPSILHPKVKNLLAFTTQEGIKMKYLK